MGAYVQLFSESFVPLFAVMSCLPVLPVVLNTVDELSRKRRARALWRAWFTTVILGVLMLTVGGRFLAWLGVRLDDFRIAGGIILLVFAVHDLLFTRVERKQKAAELDHELFESARLHSGSFEEEDPSIAPLGIPILFGPASMTALVVFSQTKPMEVVFPAFAANAVLNGLVLWQSGPLAGRIGRPLMRALGKVMAVVLAAMAVSMLRVGLSQIVKGS